MKEKNVDNWEIEFKYKLTDDEFDVLWFSFESTFELLEKLGTILFDGYNYHFIIFEWKLPIFVFLLLKRVNFQCKKKKNWDGKYQKSKRNISNWEGQQFNKVSIF